MYSFINRVRKGTKGGNRTGGKRGFAAIFKKVAK